MVFLWRSAGSDRDASGVVAECRVASPVSHRGVDTESLPFWKGEEPKAEDSVDLIVIRVAGTRQVLKRDWLSADPVLKGLLLFRMAQGTNYLLNSDEAARLKMLWSRTGVDWTWRESVAGLWAYGETHGKEISKLPGSPVAAVALLTGRAVSSVYNKVMNFRALDPTDERKGFDGAGEVDRAVWNAFFDAALGQLSRVRLAAEVKRLGLSLGGSDVGPATSPAEVPEAAGPLATLLKKYEAGKEAGVFPALPDVAVITTETFVRNPLVASIARLRASCRCEIPDCAIPTFKTEAGEDFCEVHHVVALSEGGMDVIENAICLCPTHHREAHHGKLRAELREVMKTVRHGMVKTSAASDGRS